MSLSDYPVRGEIAASHAGDLVGWRAEVGARIHDFLSRKAFPATEKLGALVRAIEGAVSRASLKSALNDLLLYLRREKSSSTEDAADQVLSLLDSRVHQYRRSESIENYSAYLFTVDVVL